MTYTYQIILWNANGLAQHRQEVTETHFTDKTYFNIPGYRTYDTKHPDGTAHGGTAVIIRSSINHHELQKYETDKIQATSVVISDWQGPLTLTAAYCPPKHSINSQEFEQLFKTLGPRFIAGGDYNAKHQFWGSRLCTTRGKHLYSTITNNNYTSLSQDQPTYWPTDLRKIPDILDFFISRGVNCRNTTVNACLDLSSDHTPVLIKLCANKTAPKLYTRTDWHSYREFIEQKLTINQPMRTKNDINNATEYLTQIMTNAMSLATRETIQQEHNYPKQIREMILEKRKLRRKWQLSRNSMDKRRLNAATKKLKTELQQFRNDAFKTYLSSLTNKKDSDYSLWKATKNLERPQQQNKPVRKGDGSWARSNEEKAEVFANHLQSTFTPNSTGPNPADEESEILEYLTSPLPMDLPIKPFRYTEINHEITNNLSPSKAPGHDRITPKMIKELPKKGVLYLTSLFNAILRTSHFPCQWKLAKIIVIPKPGKPTDSPASYRPISSLPALSKVFEKVLLDRLNPDISKVDLIPDHQFGFRKRHSTIEQVHRVTRVIKNGLEKKHFCTAAFLDIQQAFDRVWHPGLLYKIKHKLPKYYLLLKSYIDNRQFSVQIGNCHSGLYYARAGVPQGSVLGPILYTLFTADLPTNNNLSVATFADDTAIIADHECPQTASSILQSHLNKIQLWLTKWKIKASKSKSVQITFTLSNKPCPEVTLNNQPLSVTKHVKYLGMFLDSRMTWKKHVTAKRKQMDLQLKKLHWLLGRKSELSLTNKLLIYKAVIKPIWTYGIQLWGTCPKTTIDIIQRFQSKTLRLLANAPWYVTNATLHNDLEVKYVQEEIKHTSERYIQRLETHQNQLALALLRRDGEVSRLKKKTNPLDLPHRF